MSRIFTAIAAAAFVSAATFALSMPAEAGSRGCFAGGGGVVPSGVYAHGRYGRYEFGYCTDYGHGDSLPYYPPAFYEQEPAYDGYGWAGSNANAYYDFRSYRRVYFVDPRLRRRW